MKFYNFILNRKSFYLSGFFRRPLLLGHPVSASIEATTNCNLHCPECPSGMRKFKRPTGSIGLQNFKNYLNPISKKLTYLLIYFQGEPFLNKNFIDLIKYSVSKKIYTATSTNGHFLDAENARQIVTSGLDRLIISLDGTDQQTYSSYRKNGDFETVVQGIKNIVNWKQKLKSKKPFLILQFLVLKTNEHKIDEIRKLAKDLGADRLELKTAQFYEFENGNTLMPENILYSRYVKNANGKHILKKVLRNRCLRMWQSIVITWDGKVVPCCFDKDADFIMGNLNKDTFPEIWKGTLYKNLRKNILINRKTIPICCNCTE